MKVFDALNNPEIHLYKEAAQICILHKVKREKSWDVAKIIRNVCVDKFQIYFNISHSLNI